MNEQPSQVPSSELVEQQKPNQEENISLERPEMVKEFNELLREWEALDSFDRDQVLQGRGEQRNIDIYNRKNELYGKVTNIDKYRDLAKSNDEIVEYEHGDVSDSEKMQAEKERIDKEINKLKDEIEQAKQKLEYLRTSLGLPPAEDIPSLIDKSSKLEKLIEIQKDLANKLSFENKKNEVQNEENFANIKRENLNLSETLQKITQDVSKLSRYLEERSKLGYNKIFKHPESLIGLKNRLSDNASAEEYKRYLLGLNSIVSDIENFKSVKDNPDSLREIAKIVREVSQSIKEQTSKIKDEERRKQTALDSSKVIDSLEKTNNFLIKKALALEAYLR